MICSVVATFEQVIRRKPPEGGLHAKSLPTPAVVNKVQSFLRLDYAVVNIAHLSK
jgi:hypothetical protein